MTAQTIAAVGAWIDHVEAATGVKPIIYTGRYFWQDNVGTDEFADHPLWIALLFALVLFGVLIAASYSPETDAEQNSFLKHNKQDEL